MEKNLIGYPILSEKLRQKLFETKDYNIPEGKVKDKLIEDLAKFDIEVPVKTNENLYDGDLPIPDLVGGNIKTHFEFMAKEFIGEALELFHKFCSKPLAPIPPEDKYVIQPGWTCYHFNGEDWEINKVDYPQEKIFIFDTETFVKKGAYPVIGTALSTKSAYIWLADEMTAPINNINALESTWTSWDLIPIGTDRVIIGHNVAYDRIRTQEAYHLNRKPENIWFDLQSAHIAVSGLASGQRWFYVLKHKADVNKDALTDIEHARLRYPAPWSDEGSTNSLVEVYNFHVVDNYNFFAEPGTEKEKLKPADKEIRDKFVKAERIEHLLADREPLISYAMKDSYYTGELAQQLIPKYLDSIDSLVGLAGHVHLLTSKLTLIPHWKAWIEDCDKVYNEQLEELSGVIAEVAKDLYDKWLKAIKLDIHNYIQILKLDPVLLPLFNETRTKEEMDEILDHKPILMDLVWSKKHNKVYPRYLNKKLKPVETLIVLKLLAGRKWESISQEIWCDDDWLNQLDWDVNYINGKLCPSWFSPWLKNPNHQVSTKTQITQILLKLTWRNCPIVFTKDNGICYIVNDNEERKDNPDPIVSDYFGRRWLRKVPHKSGYGKNVGGLLSKDYLDYAKTGILGGLHSQISRALDIATSVSYWTSTQKRVKDMIVRQVENPYGSKANVTVPQLLAHGTVTKRTTAPLLTTLTSHKENKVGTELKSRIEAPEGWDIVQADFDS